VYRRPNHSAYSTTVARTHRESNTKSNGWTNEHIGSHGCTVHTAEQCTDDDKTDGCAIIDSHCIDRGTLGSANYNWAHCHAICSAKQCADYCRTNWHTVCSTDRIDCVTFGSAKYSQPHGHPIHGTQQCTDNVKTNCHAIIDANCINDIPIGSSDDVKSFHHAIHITHCATYIDSYVLTFDSTVPCTISSYSRQLRRPLWEGWWYPRHGRIHLPLRRDLCSIWRLLLRLQAGVHRRPNHSAHSTTVARTHHESDTKSNGWTNEHIGSHGCTVHAAEQCTDDGRTDKHAIHCAIFDAHCIDCVTFGSANNGGSHDYAICSAE
jgi:hypothetical protein